MLNLRVSWEPDGEAATLRVEDAEVRLSVDVSLPAGLRLALALLSEPGLAEARRLELVDELFLLVPCKVLFEQLGRQRGSVEIFSRTIRLAEVNFSFDGSGLRRGRQPDPQEIEPSREPTHTFTNDLDLIGRRVVGLRDGLWRLAVVLGFAVFSVLGPQDDLLWHTGLAVFGTAPPAFERLPPVGILTVQSSPHGRNDREAMAAALQDCADRGPSWIAVDVPYDLREADDEVLWTRVDELRRRLPVMVGVSSADRASGVPSSLGAPYVLDPGDQGASLRMQRAALAHPATAGAATELVPDLTLGIAARTLEEGLGPGTLKVYERQSARGAVTYVMTDLVLGGTLGASGLRCARWSPVAIDPVGSACAPGQGTIVSFADWELTDPSLHRDIHYTWIAGALPRQDFDAASCIPTGLTRGQFPGPVYMGALALTLAAGSPYRPLGEALVELFWPPSVKASATALGSTDLRGAFDVVPSEVSGPLRVAGTALYMALLMFVSPVGYARRGRRPMMRVALSLPFAVHLVATAAAFFLFRVLTPVSTGAALTLGLAIWPARSRRPRSKQRGITQGSSP